MNRGHAARAMPLVAVLVALLLAGCAGTPRQGATDRPAPGADGPPAVIPEKLALVPDAEPRIEPIRPGGANKPYEALGERYVPLTQDVPFRQRGLASWYGRKFHGKRTASGEPYDMFAMTGAHPTLPLPSYVRVRNPANDAEVVLRINDRGPFHSTRIMDLSYTAALRLGVLNGVSTVEIERITFDDIRTGAWRRPGVPVPTVEPPAAADAVLAAVVLPAPVPAPDPLPVEATSAAVVAPAPVAASPAPGFWVQLGAFQQRAGAEGFHRRVAADVHWLAPLLAVFNEQQVFRLQAGPYASRDEAQGIAQRVREALKLAPLVLERR